MFTYRWLHSRLSGFLGRRGFRLLRTHRIPGANLSLLDLGVSTLLRDSSSITFVQVGANDGETNDPLCRHLDKYDWRGALIEPDPAAFERLLGRYGRRRGIHLYQCAVAAAEGTLTLFFDASGTGDALRQKTSSNPEHLVRHGVPRSAIQAREVRAVTVRGVIEELHFDGLDLLVVDTEGMDFDIVSGVLRDGLAPRVIFFEHVHMSREQRSSMPVLLAEHGYKYVEDQKDTLAVHTRVL